MAKKFSVRDKLVAAIAAARTVYGAAGSGRALVIAEASAMTQLALDEVGYRRAGGGWQENGIEPWNHTRHQAVALRLFQKHHMARRLLHLITDFVVGDGITVAAKTDDEATQKAYQLLLDEFWNDPINAMDKTNEQRCIEWNLWGEICMPVRRNEQTGQIRLGWITPRAIEAVEPDVVTGQPAWIVLTAQAAEAVGRPRLSVIRVRDDVDGMPDGVIEGDCFYRAINTPWGADRGISELYTAADWLDVLDNTLRAHADRAKLDSYFIWDVTLHGADEPTVAAWVAANADKRPKPNSIRAHNEKVEWKCVSPALGSADMAEHIRTLKTYIMGGFGYPNHWFGSGDDANLATAAVMSEPTRKNLRRKQKQFKGLMVDVLKYVMASYQAAGRLPREYDTMGEPFDVQIPDLSGPDIAKVGAAMTQIAAAIQVAEENGWISHDTAMEMFAAIASETGLTIDPAAEREKVDEDDRAGAQDDKDAALKDEEDLRELLNEARAAREQGAAAAAAK